MTHVGSGSPSLGTGSSQRCSRGWDYVLEIGCADAFVTGVVQQEVGP